MTKRNWGSVFKRELLLITYVFSMVVSAFMALSCFVWGCQWLDKAGNVVLFVVCMLGTIVFGRLAMLFWYWAKCQYSKIKKEQKFWN